jgi:predicted secreted protein
MATHWRTTLMTGLFAIAISVAAGTAAITACPSVMPQEHHVVLTDADNGKEVALSTEGTLTVKLPAQMGTGYSWQVEDVDKDRLAPPDKPTLESTAKDTAGGTDLQVFTFKPVKAGTTALKFRYVRPWEKDAKPQKTFSVNVKIN